MPRCAAVFRSPWGFPGRLLSGCLLLGVWWVSSQAQVPTAITPDGTLGTAVTQMGTIYTITGGTRPRHGPNLFHSFDRFSVGTGDTAHFTGPTGIAHILSRVTGGQPSRIDGRLLSTIPGASLYLLNPNGVLFGPNASLDVSGSLYVSTADYVRLADGATFAAHLSEKSTLTVAPPAAFGFFGPMPAPMTVQGSTLQVPTGKTLLMVGGDLTIQGNNDPFLEEMVPTLSAPGGQIHLASLASAGEVPINLRDLNMHAFARLGRLEISQALLDVSGDQGGSILLRSGHLLVDQSSLLAVTHGPGEGANPGIDLQVAADAFARRSVIATISGDPFILQPIQPIQTGRAGDIVVRVGRLTLRDATITSLGLSEGQGGNVWITATDEVALLGSAVPDPDFLTAAISTATGAQHGQAGRVGIFAPILRMENQALIETSAVLGARGGDIEIQVGRLTLINGARINSLTVGSEPGGNMTITATDAITIVDQRADPGLFPVPSGIANQHGSNGEGSGPAGRVTLSAPTLTMDEGLILADASGGRGGDIEVRVGRLTLTNGAQISNSARKSFTSGGQAGDLTITATDAIVITGRTNFPAPLNSPLFSRISLSSGVFSQTLAPGDAGRVSITTPHLSMDAGGQIAADTGEAGRGGDMQIQVGALSLTGGAQITSRSGVPAPFVDPERRTGPGGRVSITATGVVTITGPTSGLFSEAHALGPGGDIALHARELRLSAGAAISAASVGLGNAGNLRLTTTEGFRSDHSTVTTEATQADGGNITLTAGSRFHLVESQLTASVGGGPQTVGGNLRVQAPFIILQGDQIRANAFAGQGGNIRLEAGVFLADPASLVSASSTLGIAGTVDIQALVTDLSGSVTPLPQDFRPTATLLNDPCAARLHEGTVSSFVVRERASLPASYDDMLPTRLYEPPGHQAPPAGPGLPARLGTTFPTLLPEAATFVPLQLEHPCARP